MSRKNIVKEKQMIEIVDINKTISLKEKIIERITKLEGYIHEDDTPETVKEVFKNELKHLRSELKRS